MISCRFIDEEIVAGGDSMEFTRLAILQGARQFQTLLQIGVPRPIPTPWGELLAAIGRAVDSALQKHGLPKTIASLKLNLLSLHNSLLSFVHLYIERAFVTDLLAGTGV